MLMCSRLVARIPSQITRRATHLSLAKPTSNYKSFRMAGSPSLLIVPGIYEGTEVFEPIIKRLQELGHVNVSTAALRSTGTDSHRKPIITMDDDIASIASDLKRVVEDAGASGVVLLLHSAGGYLGSAAMKGLSVSARKAANMEGGIRKIVFLSAGIAPEGFKVGPGWFMVYSVRTTQDYAHDSLPNAVPESRRMEVDTISRIP